MPDALQLAVLFAEPAVVVDEITPNSPQLLVKTAGGDYFRTDERMRQALLGRAEELLQDGELPPPDREQIEGAIHTLREEDEQAVASLTKAVAGRPEMTAWRYELASLLLKRGDLEGAWMHARTCVRMEPENEQFDALLKQLNRTRLR
ncbi:MAG: hypothetical protein HYV60_07945 [Planctomycetia bacterium]|nr:hypothetical protein [Planctomycetia bacterium]